METCCDQTIGLLQCVKGLNPKHVSVVEGLLQTLPAKRVAAEFAENESNLIGSLHYAKIAAWTKGGHWGMDADYTAGNSQSMGEVGFISKRFAGREVRLTVVNIFGKQLSFVCLRGFATRIFRGDKEIAQIEVVSQRRINVSDSNGNVILIRDSFWSWKNTHCSYKDVEICVPVYWPDVGRIDAGNVQSITSLPSTVRDLLLFTLLWKNTPQGMFE